MRLLLLQGPGLNLLGERPGDAPGVTADALEAAVRAEAARLGVQEVRVLQSNHEGALVDALQAARGWASFVVMNPGALAHTSYVLRDAVEASGLPVVEVHLTNLNAREAWRRQTVLGDVVRTRMLGRGVQGYLDAVRWLVDEAQGRVPAAAAAAPGEGAREALLAAGGEAGARDCAFCTEEPCELHRGDAPGGGRDTPAASRAELGMQVRALEAAALLAETDASIARVLGGVARVEALTDEVTAPGHAPRAPVRTSREAAASPPRPAESARTVKSLGPPVPMAAALSTAPASPTAAASAGTAARAPVEPSRPGALASAALRDDPGAPGHSPVRKTLGRREQAAVSSVDASAPATSLRAALTGKLAQHLAGALSAAELTTFAREGWLALDAGVPVPDAERPLLEEALRRLMFLDRGGPGAPDAHELVSLLARLQ